ncbi:Six-hairpin glycosidase-like protein [Russula dissimulans]|nr:Six-hairpin glycosidase-like protein [Russula dissimulans]
MMTPLIFLFFFFYSLPTTSANGLTDAQIDAVKQRLQEGATHSWELGTRAQALLELDAPSYSVLTHPATVPPPSSSSLNASSNSSLADVLSIARNAVAVLPPPPSNGTGQPLFAGDSSAGDPASIGIAVLIANWTNLAGEDYAGAATAQVEYLFGPAVPKTSDGAISHRVSQVQLWSDFVYMVPPFLVYYGVTTSNQSMMQAAYQQIKLYRNYLSDDSANGLWRHVVLGSNGTDYGHWSTGNAWAAAGMLRVLGTLSQSPHSRNFRQQIRDLGNWVAEIHNAMYPHLQSNGLFKNYADGNASNGDNFDDASSSALLAATVYRLALLTGNKNYIPQAELTRAALFASNGTGTSTTTTTSVSGSSTSTNTGASPSPSASTSPAFADMLHFTSDGWLTPVVDPLDVGSEGTQSPEGEAFTLMLQAAWRDWSAAGSPGASSAAPAGPTAGWGIGWGGAGVPVWAGVGLVVVCTFGDLFV